jgi:hypothetical protein
MAAASVAMAFRATNPDHGALQDEVRMLSRRAADIKGGTPTGQSTPQVEAITALP